MCRGSREMQQARGRESDSLQCRTGQRRADAGDGCYRCGDYWREQQPRDVARERSIAAIIGAWTLA